MSPDEVLTTFAGAFVDELVRSGVRHVVICPGSRSTPLAILFDEHPGICVWMHLDERSAAFFALGMAKGLREPTAVLCTSGTAAANFLPAVVEARYGRVPLIVLTADRPSELQDLGAPQTIDQSRLYGTHVKWSVDVALPEGTETAIRYVRVLADRAAATASAAPAGPVHLNFPFREPLMPNVGLQPMEATCDRFANRAEEHPLRPLVAVRDVPSTCEPAFVASLAAEVVIAERVLIVCGPQDDPALPSALAGLARVLDCPILADPLSQVRCGPHSDGVIARYDAFLRDATLADSLEPDLVLRFGASPTSKTLTQYLQRCSCRQMVIDPAGWNDPINAATDIIHADATLFAQAIEESMAGGDAVPSRTWSSQEWATLWRELDAVTGTAIVDTLAEIEEPFEGKVFAELAQLVPEGTTIWVGSSMPVRDLDTFCPIDRRAIRFLANRGANGIDGVVSSALGASIAGPLLLVIGDISFYHDMNGLLAAKLHQLNATIILLNNDGGGIFNFLPQAGTGSFETLFGTPHGLDFEPAAMLYGASFHRVTDWPSFRAAVTEHLGASGLSIIEMPTERERNVALHRTIWARIADMILAAHEVGV